MTKKKQTQYVVVNPKPDEVSSEVPMILFHGKEWNVGDTFERPEGMSDKGFQRLLERGFIING